MTWNTSTPAGTDPISSGDDVIRAMKSDLQNAFRGQTTEGLEGVFPGTDSANPVLRPRFLRGATASRPSASANAGIYIDTTRNVIQRCNDSTWDDIATLIPAGTVMLFFQASAPTGWTQVTTQNNKALRVVSGTGAGTGGSIAFTTAFSGNTGDESSHTHTGTTSTPTAVAPMTAGTNNVANDVHAHTFTTSGGSAHSHAMPDLQYIDVILASKD